MPGNAGVPLPLTIVAEAIIRSLQNEGYVIVHPDKTADLCRSPVRCCIHQPSEDDE